MSCDRCAGTGRMLVAHPDDMTPALAAFAGEHSAVERSPYVPRGQVYAMPCHECMDPFAGLDPSMAFPRPVMPRRRLWGW